MKWGLGILALIVVGGGIYWFATNRAQAEGRVVVSVTDAATTLSGEGVTSFMLNVDKVTLNGNANGAANGELNLNNTGTSGNVNGNGTASVDLVTSPAPIDLVGLKNLNAQAGASGNANGNVSAGTLGVLADTMAPAGTYNGLTLTISKPVVTTANGTATTLLPGTHINIPGTFVVQPNSTTNVTLDFNGDKSLVKTTTSGTFVVAPVLTAQEQTGAQVSTGTIPSGISTGAGVTQSVVVNGGTPTTPVTVGMDQTGQTGVGVSIDGNAKLDILAGNIIRLETSADAGVHVNVSVAANNVVSKGLVDKVISVQAVTRGGKVYLLVSGTKNGENVSVLVDATGSADVIGVQDKAGANVSISSQQAANTALSKGLIDSVSSVTPVTVNGSTDYRVTGTTGTQQTDVTIDGTTGAVLGTQPQATGTPTITANAAANTAISTKNLDVVLSTTLVTHNGKLTWRVSGTLGLQLRDVYVDAQTGAIVQ